MVIGGGTYAKSLKNIIAFGPEKLGVDYRIHGADEFILVSEMEEAVEVYKLRSSYSVMSKEQSGPGRSACLQLNKF